MSAWDSHTFFKDMATLAITNVQALATVLVFLLEGGIEKVVFVAEQTYNEIVRGIM